MGRQGQVDISVLIVAYRSRATAARLSKALEALDPAPAEILVLENGSPEDERVTAADLPLGARLIESGTNLGFAGGANALAREARSAWLAFLNPDAFPAPDWLARLDAARLRHPDYALFGSTQKADCESGVLDGVGDVYHATGLPYRGGYGRRLSPPPDGEVFGPCAAAALIEADLFQTLGGFDEDYFCYVEDVDLAYRARLLGHRAIQVRDAVVSHMGYASSGRRSGFATYHGARNRLWTFLKDTPAPLIYLLAPAHGLVTLALWASAARFGQFVLFATALRDAFAAWPELMKKRRAVQSSRRVGAWAIARAMSWNPIKLFRRSPDVRPVQPARSCTSPERSLSR